MASTQTHDHELIEQAKGILREAGIPVENQKSALSFQPVPIDQMHRVIDHTLLKAEATEDQIIALCAEAKAHHFASVCVNPCFVPTAAQQLNGSDVAVCTVIGFPLGATLTSVKTYEAETAISAGATEVDMVINGGWLKSKKYKEILHEIRQIVAVSRDKAIVKVIIETALLSDLEKVIACLLSRIAGADFVKTSTGFSSGGATASDIRLMRLAVGPEMGVKASGGVRLLSDAEQMLMAGATRIGASASVAIVKGEGTPTSGY